MFDPPQTSYPVSAFEQLIPALANVLKAVHDGGDNADEPQHRQAVAQATDELKVLIANAKTLIDGLPGGEMLERDQDEVIRALETLKQQKLQHIAELSKLMGATLPHTSSEEVLPSQAKSPVP